MYRFFNMRTLPEEWGDTEVEPISRPLLFPERAERLWQRIHRILWRITTGPLALWGLKVAYPNIQLQPRLQTDLAVAVQPLFTPPREPAPPAPLAARHLEAPL